MKYTLQKQEAGFTLLEMMITMGIALVMMAGMMAVFVSQTRTSSMLKGKTESMGDLFLASQIMQSELRSAKTICWDGAAVLSYQPSDSYTSVGSNMSAANPPVVIPAAACKPPVPGTFSLNGYFSYEKTKNPTGTDWRVMWRRPKTSSANELVRGLLPKAWVPVNNPAATPKNGFVVPTITLMTISPYSSIYTVTMKSLFNGQDNQSQPLNLTFKVWARN